MSEDTAGALRAFERRVQGLLEIVCSALLVAMVAFTAYTVVMRYAFRNPPFWGDTLTMFCNIWLVLIAYAMSVRKRDFIAMQGAYAMLPAGWPAALNLAWNLVTAAFGAFLGVFGVSAAANVPGSYWELGGLPNKVPMAIMPIAGVLILLAALRNVAEDLALRRRKRESGSIAS
jgi:TRAP-type C4-dicarboxylate transport system permease small subunit